MLSDRISCSRNTETAVASSCTSAQGIAEPASAISTAGKRPANLARSMPASIAVVQETRQVVA